MTRYEAKMAILEVINSGILDMALEGDLTEVVNCICGDGFGPCPAECLRYCKQDECPCAAEEALQP